MAGVLDGCSTREAIAHWARETPDKPAIIDYGHVISFRAFSNAIDRWVDTLSASQRPIRKAAVIIPRLCNSWIMSFALRDVGADVIALNSLSQIAALGLADLDCVVASKEVDAATPLTLVAPGPLRLIVPDHPGASPSGAPPAEPRRKGQPGGQILYTSGTTGRYKLLLFDHAGEGDRNRLRAGHYRITQQTLHHGVIFRMWTGSGYKHASATWWCGGTVVFDGRVERFFEQEVTTACLTGGELRSLLVARRSEAPKVLPRPWRLVFGGGFLPLELALGARDELNAVVDVALGATETAGALLHSIFHEPEDLNWYSTYPDRTVEILDDQGQPCPVGQQGELAVVLKPFDAQGYLDDEAATGRFFRDGRFFTGDLAVQRADGRIRVLGRVDHVLNFQGQKRPVAPIETEIQILTGARDVCAFAGFDLTGHEIAVIALEVDRPPPTAILDRAAALFPGFSQTRFHMEPHLPRGTNGMGKVDRRALRSRLFPHEA